MVNVNNVQYTVVSHGGEANISDDTVVPSESGWVEIQANFNGLSDSIWVYIFPIQPTVDVNFGEYGDDELILSSQYDEDYTGMIMVDQETEEILNTYNAMLDVHSDLTEKIEGCTIDIVDKFTFDIKGITSENIPEDVENSLIHLEYKMYYDENNYILALDKYIPVRV